MKDEKPFNDVIDHVNKIEGGNANIPKGNLKKLPKPLKYFGYTVMIFFTLSILLMVILAIVQD